MVIRTGDHPRDAGGTIRLSDDQFDRLCELLAPGHKMASVMLEQHDRSRAGEGIPGTMDPGPQHTAAGSRPAPNDPSKGEGNPMDPGPAITGGAGAPPAYDDPSKQGSG